MSLPSSRRLLILEHEVPATDGLLLAVTLYQGARQEARRVAILNAAVGVARGSYREYAQFLAESGWTVVTFDYRGIGGSLRQPLAQVRDRLRDWGVKDLAGILDWVERELEPQRCVVVGHSIGGQIVGFAPNHHRVDAMVTVAGQKGYWKYWSLPHRYLVGGFWLILPLLVRTFGYLPLWPAGCENLPPEMALEWWRWSRRPEFVDENWRSLNHYFRTFTSPILALSFSDDRLYAPRRAVQALLEIYANAPSQHWHFQPRDLGQRRVGHSGFFQAGVCPDLWRRVAQWLEGTEIAAVEGMRGVRQPRGWGPPLHQPKILGEKSS